MDVEKSVFNVAWWHVFLFFVVFVAVSAVVPYSTVAQSFKPTGSLVFPPDSLHAMNTGHPSDQAIRLNDGRVIIFGVHPELYDPATKNFSLISNAPDFKNSYTATLLNNGKVLIIGSNLYSSKTDAELYDPVTNTFSATGNMQEPGENQVATLLSDGKVLVTGGYKYTYNSEDVSYAVMSKAELYDPATGTFSATGDLTTPRELHTTTLLADGRVLVTGGSNNSNVALSSAEIYDPKTGVFSAIGNLQTARGGHTATRLNNGKVLIIGGFSADHSPLINCELYNPVTETFESTGNLRVRRSAHQATLVSDGKVLVTGGEYPIDTPLSRVEIYDPSTGAFKIMGDLRVARSRHSATLLNDGKVLVAGGINDSGSAELYNPVTGTSELSAERPERYDHTATKLQDGKVLIAGGGPLTAQLYDPASGTFTTTGSLIKNRSLHTATLLNDGRVLFIGSGGSNPQTVAELYDPNIGTFSATGSLHIGRVWHTATLLRSGKVLVIGGYGTNDFLSSAELYDPNTGTFSLVTGSMYENRGHHTATLLSNGKVLVVGGQSYSEYLSSAELYDPTTNTFSLTASLHAPRAYQTETLLNNGKVLIAAGQNSTGKLASAEIYDPATGTFSVTGNLNQPRYSHTATRLIDGTVLVNGGFDGSVLASAEIYNPDTGTFRSTGNMIEARVNHTSTLLDNGTVLVTAGHGALRPLASAELYVPAATISISDASVREGNPVQGAPGSYAMNFTITLATAQTQAVTVNYSTANGTGKAPDDYIAANGTITIPAGQTTAILSVVISGDALDEDNENFYVLLSSATNSNIARGRGVGTIIDDDASPFISVDDLSISEGNSGQRAATFRLSMSAPSGRLVKVSYATSDGSAKANTDYTAVAPTPITFAVGQTVAFARVLINGDLLNETDETFKVTLSGALNANIAVNQAVGTIVNDDRTPALTIDDVSIMEGNPVQGLPSTKTITFTVNLSAPSGQTISVNYATADGSARSSSDYVAQSGTLSFSSGQTSKTIIATIQGDAAVENDEAFYVLMSGAVNATVGKARGIGTIINDDGS